MSGSERAKKILRAWLPRPLLDVARSIQRRTRRRKWAKRVSGDPDALQTQAMLAADLRDLGVQRGQDLIVHSAMSTLGLLEHGADTFIDALVEVVGPEGTVLMPTYPMKANMLDTMQEEDPFDVANDESTMGKITRVFRIRAGAHRSAHPTHSVTAIGPNADDYTKHHHESASPCGPGSPFRLLSERRGAVLCIGTGVGKSTSHHTIEDLVDGFPIDVYEPELAFKDVCWPDGTIRRVGVRVHRPELALVRVDNHPGVEAELKADMERVGMLREGKVGQATAHLFGAAELDELHRDRLSRLGTTIYRLKEQAPSAAEGEN